MAPSTLTSAWTSFWHTMTSADRHATPNSPYRTGRHVPLSQNRNAPLTSVATDAAESEVDLTSTSNASNAALDASNPYFSREAVHSDATTPTTPYTPGQRSAMQRSNSAENATSSPKGSIDVQMSTFSDGLPPAPPVKHSWKRIDRWTEDNYEELWDNMGEPATMNDINELEHQLDCTLPQDVRDSLQIHDGQERGGLPTGIIFGCMLLDCEEIVEEWTNWRRVTDEVLNKAPTYEAPLTMSTKSPAASSSTSHQQVVPTQTSWREELLARQDSQPTGAVLKAYTHPAWIPLARDWGGNCLAVDLAPGPAGKWGQIILFGRDYDCKFVIARSWAAFLATVADDMGTSKVFVSEDSGELKLREFKQQDVEPAYIDILRWRADQKYGRKAPRRPSPADRRMHPNAAAHIARGNATFGSPGPVDGSIDGANSGTNRGRSPHRFKGKNGAASSPRGGTISSPLARVAESEEGDSGVGSSSPTGSRKGSMAHHERLVSLAPESPPNSTPISMAQELPITAANALTSDGPPMVDSEAKHMANGDANPTGLGVDLIENDKNSLADEMKTVEI